MKYVILLYIFFFTLHLNAQAPADDCVRIEESANHIILYINKVKYEIAKNESAGANVTYKIECNEDSLSLIEQVQNGNEYAVHYTLFHVDSNKIYTSLQYQVLSNRHEYSLIGLSTEPIDIKSFSLKTDYFNTPDTVEIQHISGLQDEKATTETSFSKLIQKLHKKKKLKLLEVALQPFVLNELNAFEALNITELNNIAYYAYQVNCFKQALYILIKVVEKSPKRAVAFLNLADTYWKLNLKDSAIQNYKKYITLMGEENRKNKIPGYVKERALSED